MHIIGVRAYPTVFLFKTVKHGKKKKKKNEASQQFRMEEAKNNCSGEEASFREIISVTRHCQQGNLRCLAYACHAQISTGAARR